VELVYIANMMSDVQDAKRGYFTIDPGILKKFTNIDSLESFQAYLDRVEKGYQHSINEEKQLSGS
jgi:hypothetical protein